MALSLDFMSVTGDIDYEDEKCCEHAFGDLDDTEVGKLYLGCDYENTEFRTTAYEYADETCTQHLVDVDKGSYHNIHKKSRFEEDAIPSDTMTCCVESSDNLNDPLHQACLEPGLE